MDTNLILSIVPRTKTIPYEAQTHPDGSNNYGFKPLKGRLGEIATIPEIQDLCALRETLEAINHPATALFSIGCEKAFNQLPNGFWAKGFVEFAFNHPDLALDASYCFKLFFDFNHMVWDRQFDLPLQYHFELEGAHFLSVDRHGYTTCVWLTTLVLPTADEAKDVYSRGLRFLADFLRQIPCQPLSTIY